MNRTEFVVDLCPECTELLLKVIQNDKIIKRDSSLNETRISMFKGQEVLLLLCYGPEPILGMLPASSAKDSKKNKAEFIDWAKKRVHLSKH